MMQEANDINYSDLNNSLIDSARRYLVEAQWWFCEGLQDNKARAQAAELSVPVHEHIRSQGAKALTKLYALTDLASFDSGLSESAVNTLKQLEEEAGKLKQSRNYHSGLYELSEQIIQISPVKIVHIEAHDPSEPYSADHLYIVYNETDEKAGNCYGYYLSVVSDNGCWSVSYKEAINVGGDPTYWSVSEHSIESALAKTLEFLSADLIEEDQVIRINRQDACDYGTDVKSAIGLLRQRIEEKFPWTNGDKTGCTEALDLLEFWTLALQDEFEASGFEDYLCGQIPRAFKNLHQFESWKNGFLKAGNIQTHVKLQSEDMKRSRQIAESLVQFDNLPSCWSEFDKKALFRLAVHYPEIAIIKDLAPIDVFREFTFFTDANKGDLFEDYAVGFVDAGYLAPLLEFNEIDHSGIYLTDHPVFEKLSKMVKDEL